MKVKLVNTEKYVSQDDGKEYTSGDVVEVEDGRAAALIQQGYAVEAKGKTSGS